MKSIVIIAIAVTFLFIPISAYADDFQIETKCESGDLVLSVRNQENSLLANAKILTIKGLTGYGGYDNKYFSNEKGEITIPYSENTGYIWIQKGGFNDKKLSIIQCSINEIPSWIKTNADWWIKGEIDEDSFIQGMQYLVKNNIIKIPKVSDEEMTSAVYNKGERIPQWVTQNVQWWVNGGINDDTFLQGMQFLVINRIINVEEKPVADNFAVDSNLPSIETLRGLGIDQHWDVGVSPSERCSTKAGIESHRQISAIKSTFDSRTGETEEFTIVSAEICKFDKISNSQRGLTGSTSLEDEMLELSNYSGTSQTSGECFLFDPVMIDYDNFGSMGVCTYGTHLIISSISSTESIDAKWSMEVISVLMDEMLENVNQMKGEEHDTTFQDILKLQKQSIPTSDIETKTGETISEEGFSGLYCTQDEYGFVTMTGRFTNGPDSYSTVWFTLGVLDYQDRIVATGLGSVKNIGPFQTKIFDASASWSGDFKECIIEVDTAYP